MSDQLKIRGSTNIEGVLCTRAGIVESVHAVHAAVVGADGVLSGRVGSSGFVTFFRSAAKPIQALPLVEDGVLERFALTPAELALCCSSHNGEADHLEGVTAILAKIGLDEGALACGVHPPYGRSESAALMRKGEAPRTVHNNCSGKHAGMLALAVAHGWEIEGYLEAEHPVQQRMLAEVARWSQLPQDELGTGIDGCGVVCFALPVEGMARAFSGMAAAAARGEAAQRVVNAMTTHPFLVAGSGRLCTDLMVRSEGKIFAKIGAEGVYCAGVPESGIGVAVKVADGGERASGVALLAILQQLGVLDSDDLKALSTHARPDLTNARDQVVGEVVAEFKVEWLS